MMFLKTISASALLVGSSAMRNARPPAMSNGMQSRGNESRYITRSALSLGDRMKAGSHSKRTQNCEEYRSDPFSATYSTPAYKAPRNKEEDSQSLAREEDLDRQKNSLLKIFEQDLHHVSNKEKEEAKSEIHDAESVDDLDRIRRKHGNWMPSIVSKDEIDISQRSRWTRGFDGTENQWYDEYDETRSVLTDTVEKKIKADLVEQMGGWRMIALGAKVFFTGEFTLCGGIEKLDEGILKAFLAKIKTPEYIGGMMKAVRDACVKERLPAESDLKKPISYAITNNEVILEHYIDCSALFTCDKPVDNTFCCILDGKCENCGKTRIARKTEKHTMALKALNELREILKGY